MQDMTEGTKSSTREQSEDKQGDKINPFESGPGNVYVSVYRSKPKIGGGLVFLLFSP